MKLPADIVRMYKEIHGWVGITSGLALFIAFYAGAITMFEKPLQEWASPPSRLAPAPPLERTPDLVAKVLAEYPDAAREHTVHLVTDRASPARVTWSDARGEEAEHGGGAMHYASLAPDGSLQVETGGPSPVAQFVDVLHQQVGLPFDHEIAMPIMGVIALLYFIAIVSGLAVLLPSLVKDLFAVRLGRNVKRMWLDLHNVLGLFSLPFHIVIALTSVVFAFHDQFYDAQSRMFGGPPMPARAEVSEQAPPPPLMAPAQIAARVREQAPGFEPKALTYGHGRDGQVSLRVTGSDIRYMQRGPDFGAALLDPATGDITEKDYLPGHQGGLGAAISSFFGLHFGSFGGAPIRWSYFLLGLSGAFLFYTGNLLWVESRRRRERKSGAVEQTRATRILGALTVSVPLGCIAGISATVAAAKPLGLSASTGIHSAIYYAVFVSFVLWSLIRGAARSGIELMPATAAAMLLIPLASAASMASHPPIHGAVDVIAAVLALVLLLGWRSARRRAATGPRDSVWALAASRRAPMGSAETDAA